MNLIFATGALLKAADLYLKELAMHVYLVAK
jgi:hypothetical protein